MILTENLLKIDKNLHIPVYQQIANGIIAHIRQGTLSPGSALPSSRTLADGMQVHRKTIVAAYDELYAQSWIDVYPRKGIFVAKKLPDVKPRPILDLVKPHSLPNETSFNVENKTTGISLFKKSAEGNLFFNDGFPDTRIAPVELLVREYRRFANYQFTHKYLMYGPEQGSENLRNELASFLFETRGLHIGSEDILITKGVQMALYLTAQILLTKNDIVIVGEPGYSGANEVFEQAGGKLELVPVDEYGIDMDAVEAICKKKKVRLLYVIPHHHTPTTVTLSPDRRMRLLELAKNYKFAIIEDDYDFDFQYTSSPVLPLASANYYGNVIYIGSFCKTIAPGIRIGFMVAPQNFLIQVTKLRKLIDRQGEHLLEEAMANLLKNGDIGRHLKKANKLYHERRDELCRLLNEHLSDEISFKVPEGGFAIWINYINKHDTAKVAEKAAEMGLSISNGLDYYHDKNFKNHAIRLGFASLNHSELKEAVDILKKAIKKSYN
ncbi:GntR family transcriptional regulator/MocR family aminotransferase [Mucilaginibacter frigoritolerans]|jgi:GntR family transcriptional regulator / MocR family aminotransferase|uniref:GntR family transcriptional regulator/MocR family aminotransferase n=1 Tax=Mucilaginibacter frigoritolerans TaxID=652788 RepID=A0A562U4I0_9SPHI|nr:PLP-dependent aminotransferase family protein [Mucilaginibacter frigoritolerans]TWJ00723.1 GntR family transcriptional regulator/MocR family aminotransferase [Mucilaginibacter frigoritolerans]